MPMPTVLFAWELGAGLGHILPYRPISDLLERSGHRVMFASRDPAKTRRMLPNATCVQAPIERSAVPRPIEVMRSYPNILHNIGFDEPMRLAQRARKWQTIFSQVQPDLVIADHSPTALVALRGLPISRVVAGTGFCCPPGDEFTDLRPWLPSDPEGRKSEEERVLGTVNVALRHLRSTSLESLGQLIQEVDDTWLTTYPELDHYGEREAAAYAGTWPPGSMPLPEWPAGDGARVFCYLSPGPASVVVLRTLARLGFPTLAVQPAAEAGSLPRSSSGSLRFLNGLIDLPGVAAECDLAILNANHFCTAEFLLAGVPILQMPSTLEQLLVAQATVRLGAGVLALPGHYGAIHNALGSILSRPQFRNAGRRFAARHAAVSRSLAPERLAEVASILTRQETAAICG